MLKLPATVFAALVPALFAFPAPALAQSAASTYPVKAI